MSKQEAWIVDIDGTLALRGDRSPYDWGRVGEDLPNTPVIRIVRALAAAGDAIVYVSGRKEQCRTITAMWLHGNVCGSRAASTCGSPLFMRPDEDDRPDGALKRKIYEDHIAGTWEILGVLDDRTRVTRMWRDELKLTCLQVADGNF